MNIFKLSIFSWKFVLAASMLVTSSCKLAIAIVVIKAPMYMEMIHQIVSGIVKGTMSPNPVVIWGVVGRGGERGGRGGKGGC